MAAVAAQDIPLSPNSLDALSQRCAARPRTYGWPTPTTYRFERPGCKILIWAGDQQTDWWLLADTPAHLNDLITELWEAGDLATTLYGIAGEGEALLQSHRNNTRA